MTTIAMDAMGGDHAPRAEVEGAILAAREFGVRIALVGMEATLKQELSRHRARDLAHRNCRRHRRDHHERLAFAGFPPQEGKLHARGGALGA